MSLVWLNGEIVDAAAARIAPDDRGFLLGDGAFETMRWSAGAIRRRDRHQARLSGALDWLEIAPPDFAAVEAGASELVRRLGPGEAVLRLTVSRGAHGGGLDAPSGAQGTVLLTAKPKPVKPEAVRLATIATARRAGLESERFKLSGYAEPLAARRAARKAGADMALLVSALDGSIVCADCANVFALIEGKVVTPPVAAGALPGTARAALLEALAARGAPAREAVLTKDELARADAVFVTNAVMGVVPASHVDGRVVNPFHPAVLAAVAAEADAL